MFIDEIILCTKALTTKQSKMRKVVNMQLTSLPALKEKFDDRLNKEKSLNPLLEILVKHEILIPFVPIISLRNASNINPAKITEEIQNGFLMRYKKTFTYWCSIDIREYLYSNVNMLETKYWYTDLINFLYVNWMLEKTILENKDKILDWFSKSWLRF